MVNLQDLMKRIESDSYAVFTGAPMTLDILNRILLLSEVYMKEGVNTRNEILRFVCKTDSKGFCAFVLAGCIWDRSSVFRTAHPLVWNVITKCREMSDIDALVTYLQYDERTRTESFDEFLMRVAMDIISIQYSGICIDRFRKTNLRNVYYNDKISEFIDDIGTIQNDLLKIYAEIDWLIGYVMTNRGDRVGNIDMQDLCTKIGAELDLVTGQDAFNLLSLSTDYFIKSTIIQNRKFDEAKVMLRTVLTKKIADELHSNLVKWHNYDTRNTMCPKPERTQAIIQNIVSQTLDSLKVMRNHPLLFKSTTLLANLSDTIILTLQLGIEFLFEDVVGYIRTLGDKYRRIDHILETMMIMASSFRTLETISMADCEYILE